MYYTIKKMKDWNKALEEKLSSLGNRHKLRNKALYQMYIKQKELFEFIQDNNINIFLRCGFLLGAVRHGGYIDFGGTSYGSGFDNDPDVWAFYDYRKQLIEAFKNTKYTYKDYRTFTEYCNIHSDQDHLNYYKNKSYIDINSPHGFMIYEGGVELLDGTFIYNNNENVVFISCWKQQTNIIKKAYNTYEPYGEYSMKVDDFLPLKTINFYDTKVFVPNQFIKILKRLYGKNVMDTIFVKHPNYGGGSIGEQFQIENQHAKPVDIFNH